MDGSVFSEVLPGPSSSGASFQKGRYILGLDVGVLSLGWAAVELQDGQPVGLLDAGVRCWELLNTAETDIEQGQETPPGQVRRQMRQTRRQLFRRAQRLRRTWRALQTLGLFPPGSCNSAARKAFLETLDAQARDWLRQNVFLNAVPANLEDTWPYHLRSAALDRPLPPELLGRVFFHLAQRRGFQSNAKTRQADAQDKKEKSQVKAGIAQLRQAMEASGARTLGEYFARLDPHQERIRGRWTSRQMYWEEFEAIWAVQAPYHPEWTEEHKERLLQAIFSQRPLKSQRGLIGLCPLESKFEYPASGGPPKVLYRHRRAPMASLEAQQIRYIQRINDLEFTDPSGLVWRPSAEHRQRLYALAETQEELSFTDIRKALGIPTGKKAEGWKCNLEAGGEKKLPGNTTAARIRRILGDQAWEALGPEGQKRLVDTLLAYLSPKACQDALQTKWGFDPQTAQKLADLDLEQGYHSFSRRAIRKLLPLLKQGLRLNEAIHKVYGDRAGTGLSMDRLPPVRDLMPSVRNPLLVRALTELRKVVNALIRKYGKPVRIHIELARDLKRSRKERERLSAKMRDQEKRREKARQIARQLLGREPSGFDILKVLLAEESNWRCPYTDQPIELVALLGPEPQFEVEHIWPFHRSLDDSFANKTLCYHEENRRKGDRTPWEAYGSNPQRWAEIIQRVKNFQGPFAQQKLRRFLAKELPEDFPNRHLSDTRWITRAAADYLAVLYGGRTDPQTGRLRIQTTTGGLTALIRRALNLDSILGPGTDKTRADHRQHAIDALVVALTTAGL
ncbi:MAG: type II CRISPR RNA-guided endonuclease Cas9, partial [Thermoguttaceae bacterium]|nr:type II CRISPR RNA-guided endonuclease Cas9 [Thermoguttaceae bacterium]